MRAVASTVGHDKGGYLPFGAEQPDPVLDPGVRKELASLGVHVTLVVTVGEDGKTKTIEFQPDVQLPNGNAHPIAVGGCKLGSGGVRRWNLLRRSRNDSPLTSRPLNERSYRIDFPRPEQIKSTARIAV